MLRKFVAVVTAVCLIGEQACFAQVAAPVALPGVPSALVRGISIDANGGYELYVDTGLEKNAGRSAAEAGVRRMSTYIKIGVALPGSMFWVNLRPGGEADIIDPYLERTDMGEVLLAADVQLKQDMARFTSPRTPEGRKYWDALYAKADGLYGPDEDAVIPAAVRPWVVPGESVIRQSPRSAYIYKASLKVCLEQDWLSHHNLAGCHLPAPEQDSRVRQLNEYSSHLIRELILPKLTREVNSSPKYAALRQVYYCLLLAQWYKRCAPGISQILPAADSRDLTGIVSAHGWSKQRYFDAYMRSARDGEYAISENFKTDRGITVRQYMSGGFVLGGAFTPDAQNASGVSVLAEDDHMPVMPRDVIAVHFPADTAENGKPGGVKDGGLRWGAETDLPLSAERIRRIVGSSQPIALVADDDFPMLQTLTALYLRCGYFVVRARDGQQAFEIYEAVKKEGRIFDVVNTDNHMPRMSGLTLAEEIGFEPAIIMITGTPSEIEPEMQRYFGGRLIGKRGLFTADASRPSGDTSLREQIELLGKGRSASDADVMQQLYDMASAGDRDSKVYALDMLGIFGTQNQVLFILGALFDTDPVIRHAAIMALRGMMRPSRGIFDTPDGAMICETAVVLLSDNDTFVREMSAQLLESVQRRETIPMRIRQMGPSFSVNERLDAVRVLRGLKAIEAYYDLVAALFDEPVIAGEAAKALVRISGKKAVPLLEHAATHYSERGLPDAMRSIREEITFYESTQSLASGDGGQVTDMSWDDLGRLQEYLRDSIRFCEADVWRIDNRVVMLDYSRSGEKKRLKEEIADKRELLAAVDEEISWRDGTMFPPAPGTVMETVVKMRPDPGGQMDFLRSWRNIVYMGLMGIETNLRAPMSPVVEIALWQMDSRSRFERSKRSFERRLAAIDSAIRHLEEMASDSEALRDGGVRRMGGIDFRVLPLAVVPAMRLEQAAVPVAPNGAIPITEDLDRQWQGISGGIAAGAVPYAAFRDFIIACRSRHDAARLQLAADAVAVLFRDAAESGASVTPQGLLDLAVCLG